jgi:type I restriction enzyme S subunit
MENIKVLDLITHKISGEWGEEATTKEAVNIIRTANFTNSGIISFDIVVKREIEKDEIEKKHLKNGDIIIEKSGGSPSQPVGRVVYFEKPDQETYLSNNFTSILRPNRNKVSPKYLFYLLYNFYSTEKVLAFQNKTTGIINLKLDRYLDSEILYEPNLETQNKIVAILDKTKTILDKRQETISKYDELLRATFLEMFGNPMERPNKWEINPINYCIEKITAGSSYGGENKKELQGDELGVLKISAVTKGIFNPNEYKAVKIDKIKKKLIHPRKGDLLFSRANTLELVGATSIVDKDYDNLFLPDKLWKINTNEALIKKVYLHYVLQNKAVRKSFLSIATGSSGSMLNISMDKFRNIRIPFPSIELQEQFEVKYNKYIELKRKLKLSKETFESLQKALSQLAFKGELEFGKGIDLEVLLENDYDFFKANSDTKSIRLLLERLDKNELNAKKFYEQEIYDKAKAFVFELLKEGKIKQVFDKKTNQVKLTVLLNY